MDRNRRDYMDTGRLPSIESIRRFLVVAKELHFGRAAARLYISQPSLSNQIHKLERTLGTDLFVRTSRQVELTPAGRALLEEAPLALAALGRAAERARLAGAGVSGTVRLGYSPMAGYETLGAILAAVERDSPNLTVIATEAFSAEIPARLLAGELDVGLALFPEPAKGIRGEPLRNEPHALLLSEHHRLATMNPIPLSSLKDETLLLFPRELAPRYYDQIIAACERSGFQPQVKTFANPPPQAMVARLRATREVGLPPASYALHAGAAEPGIVTRTVAKPGVIAEWSILWAAREQPSTIARFLESARRCAEENAWLHQDADPVRLLR
jgi:DNA-binding transcriptional LysR family regulator